MPKKKVRHARSMGEWIALNRPDDWKLEPNCVCGMCQHYGRTGERVTHAQKNDGAGRYTAWKCTCGWTWTGAPKPRLVRDALARLGKLKGG